jgi:hypothetical protein|nr:hypothetical protein [uncultured Draconibacterium sp.]
MNYIKHQTGLFERFAEDERITPFHISLYFALFQFWNRNRFRNPFPVSREEVMFLAHIGSVNTYTRCIKQLHQWSYIEYFPSFNPNTGSKVSCISFEKGSDKGNGKAGDKGGDNAADKGLYKNTNITNGNKQAHSKNYKNGREKKSRNSNPLHVETDKDYSEPL